MSTDINLIPQAEVKEQQKTKVVKTSSVVAIVFLILVLITGGYYYYLTNKINNQIYELDSDIKVLRSDIKDLSEVEISARNLDKKYTVLKSLFNQRPKYSILLQELKNRKPENLQIQSLDVKSGVINISGVAEDYVSIANFVNNLVSKDFQGGLEGLQDVFTSVSLNSVSLEGATGKVKFFIVVEFNVDKIRG